MHKKSLTLSLISYSIPMATILAMTVTLIIHFTFTTTTTSTMVVAATTKPKRLVTKLIHHDSIFSPYYNPKETIEDRAQRSLNSSVARLAYLSAGAHDIRANLLPNGANTLFYINFSIGQPPVSQVAYFDTGSTFIWVKCLPCTPCSRKKGLVFNPSKSSTYAPVPCTWCNMCNSLSHCPFNSTYADGTISEGVTATEQFTFETSDEGKITVSDVVFGCGHKIGNSYNDEQLTGVFGLGTSSSTSLVNKLGSKFSYCIGNIRDSEYKYNQLILGGAEIEGYSTPLEKINGKYYITQEGISVGEKRLDIDANIFKKTADNNGVIMDTGSSYTWLARSAYDALRKEVEALLDDSILRFCFKTEDSFCCMGTISQGLYGFPVITFHFADGADLVLDAWSSFTQTLSYAYCLAIRPSHILAKSYVNNLTIIGIMAQQSYNVGYDLEANMISFQRIDCELLAD